WATWPRPTERDGYSAEVVNATWRDADLPGAIVAVVLPAILKSRATFPLLTIVKMTVPAGTVLGTKVSFEALSVTRMVVAPSWVCADAVDGDASSAAAAAMLALDTTPRRAITS